MSHSDWMEGRIKELEAENRTLREQKAELERVLEALQVITTEGASGDDPEENS